MQDLIMALISRYSNTRFFLVAILIIPFISSAFINNKQNVTLQYAASTTNSIFINLENIIQLSTPFHITAVDSKSCSPQLPSFSLTDEVPFIGSFGNGERAFIFEDHYYVIRIDKQTHQVHLGIYTMNTSRSSSKPIFIQSQRYMFKKETSTDIEIIGFQLFKSTGVFRTKSEVLLFNFDNLDNPNLQAVIPADNAPIHCYGAVGGRTLYVATENTVVAYDLRGVDRHNNDHGPGHDNNNNNNDHNKVKELSTFGNYSLPDNTQQRIQNIQSVCICDNIVFIAEGNQLLAFEDRFEIFNASSIPISKVITFDESIIHAQKVGRSLVIMTEKNLIEHTFRNDCLDFQENLRVSIDELGIGLYLPIEDKILFTRLTGSSKGRYFGVVNQLTKSVYIFEAAAIRQQDSTTLPYIYLHKSQDTIDSVDLFDYFTSYTLNGLGMIMKYRRDAMSVFVLLRNPIGVTCSNWLPSTKTELIKAESKFCHNGVYNYTDFLKKDLKGPGEMFGSDIYDPSLPCERTILLHLSYGWSKTVIIAGVCIIISVLIVIGLIVRRCYKKKKAVKKDGGHKRFHNEKEGQDNSAITHNKIDISSLSMPPSTRRNQANGNTSRIILQQGGQTQTRQKNFTKKKNLTIQIPESKY